MCLVIEYCPICSNFDSTAPQIPLKMKRILILCFLLFSLLFTSHAQNTFILNFSALDQYTPVNLDSVRVINLTRDCDTLLTWPDTTLIVGVVGIGESPMLARGFSITKVYPNPAPDFSTIEFSVPDHGAVDVELYDISGKSCSQISFTLAKGIHQIEVNPGMRNISACVIRWNSISRTVKLLRTNARGQSVAEINYLGLINESSKKAGKISSSPFYMLNGDQLLLVGYKDSLQAGITDTLEGNASYDFQFAYDIPCLTDSVVNYSGKTYATVQIFNQCWFAENLDVGTFIYTTQHMSNNYVIEKYCYDNWESSCSTNGGLYTWDEMMDYADHQGAKGICPPGWHVPSDLEWKILEGAVDGTYGIGHPEWNQQFYRGDKAGLHLKSTNGWTLGGNGDDAFGFQMKPIGQKDVFSITFGYQGYAGFFWTSTERNLQSAWARMIYCDFGTVNRQGYDIVGYNYKDYGFAVRCIRN